MSTNIMLHNINIYADIDWIKKNNWSVDKFNYRRVVKTPLSLLGAYNC